jgi:TRAP transporter 4TM/12TM fusion protein
MCSRVQEIFRIWRCGKRVIPKDLSGISREVSPSEMSMKKSDVGEKAISGVIFLAGLTLSSLIIYGIWEGTLPALPKRSIALGLCLIIVFLGEPTTAEGKRTRLNRTIAIFLAALSGLACLYAALFWWDMANRPTMPNRYDTVFCILAVLVLLEACRRSVGITISLVCIGFIAYGFIGNFVPGNWGHTGFTLARFVDMTYMYADVGLWGITLRAAVEMVIIFIIYANILNRMGGSEFFIDLANSLMGKYRGGPAKVAIIASGFFGTISGSAVANVVGTGSFTIPLMKKIGYAPKFAGAVEAVASTGGQIMPPVMGAAAFLMADMLGISYWSICVAAAIPAMLYYIAVFSAVHFEALKLGLTGMERKDLPRVKDILKRGWFLCFSPLVLLFLLGVMEYSAGLAGLYSILVLLIVYVIQHSIESRGKGVLRMGRVILNAFAEGGRLAASITVALACVGIIISVLGITGLGLKLAGLLVDLSGGKLLVLAGYTMIASLILGMGLPTSACYVIVAVTAAPALINLGVTPIASHLFVFYFGIICVITPPVALAAYAAAGIAKSNPMSTGLTASRLGVAAFIVPYMFILNPVLIFEGKLLNVFQALISATAGVVFLAAGLEGYFVKRLNPLQKILAVAAAIMLIHPGSVTDLFGLAIGLLVIVWHLLPPMKGRSK